MKAIFVLMPKYRLRKKNFNLNGENWGKFTRNSYKLLAILKAFQFQQSNGLGWFRIDEDVLDIHLPKWKQYSLELIEVGILKVNPYNDKLDFEDYRCELRRLEFPNKKVAESFKKLLVRIDPIRYGKVMTC